MRLATMNDATQRLFREFIMEHGTKKLFNLTINESIDLLQNIDDSGNIIPELFYARHNYWEPFVKLHPIVYYDSDKDWCVLNGLALVTASRYVPVTDKIQCLVLYAWIGHSLIAGTDIRWEINDGNNAAIQIRNNVKVLEILLNDHRITSVRRLKSIVNYEDDAVKEMVWRMINVMDKYMPPVLQDRLSPETYKGAPPRPLPELPFYRTNDQNIEKELSKRGLSGKVTLPAYPDLEKEIHMVERSQQIHLNHTGKEVEMKGE